MKTVSTMGSGHLGRELDLKALIAEIESKFGDSIRSNFTSVGIVTFRLSNDTPAYTVYRTGTFQIRGAKSRVALKDAENTFLNVLDEIGLDIQNYEFDHVLSVFTDDLNQDVNLSALAISLGFDSIEYEPEQFPGLVYRPSESENVLLIFASGKVVVTGGKSRGEAKKSVAALSNYVNKLPAT